MLINNGQNYLERGDIIRNHYKIIERWGEGSFGQTYKAQDTDNLGKIVVIKRLKINNFSGSDLKKTKELFEREALTLGKLQHPMIPRLEAYFIEEDENCYLVMEYIEGNTLDQQELKENHQLKQKEVIELLKDTLEVLKIVHEQGLVHRDIKPDNLIRRAKDQKISLIDFGSVTKELNWRQQTQIVGPIQQKTRIGSMYSAPEQRQIGSAFPNSDIYALGMIAIQALKGSHLDPNKPEIVWNEVPTISENFKNVLQRMTKEEHCERYQSVDEVLQDLHLIEESPPNLPSQSSKNTWLTPIFIGSLIVVASFGIGVVISTNTPKVSRPLFPLPDPTKVVSGTKIKIAGSVTMVRLNNSFKEGFEEKYPSATIDLAAYQNKENRGSNYGIELLCQGKVDIASISRSLDKDEKCRDGKKLFAVEVGTDSLSVVVHRDNPVNNLSKSQVKEIFQCQISQWTDIDPTWTNKNLEIEVLNRPPQSGTYNYFQEKFLDNKDFCLQGSPNYRNLKLLDDDETTLTNRNFTINQIGYAAYGLTDFSRLKRLSIDNVKPEDESYPYQRPLYYVYIADSPENPSLPVKQFLGFVSNFDQSPK